MFPLMVSPALGQDVFWHSFYVAGVDSPQVGVLNKPHQRGLFCLLQSTQGCALKAQICFEDQRIFSHQALKEEPVDWVCGLLTNSNFSQCYLTRTVTMFLHPSNRGRTLTCSFCSQLLPGCLYEPRHKGPPLTYSLLWDAAQRAKGSSGTVVRNTIQSHHCLVLSESLTSPGLK